MSEMDPEVEKRNRYVVYRSGEYLVGNGSRWFLRWSTSPWDAWWHRRRDKAQEVAGKTGGKVRQFNPITGRIVA